MNENDDISDASQSSPGESPPSKSPPSKSQRKREAHAAQALGKQLVALKPAKLKQLPIDEELYQAIIYAQSLHNKYSALKRQLQFIGKLMRGLDTNELSRALDKTIKPHADDVKRFHLVEKWRDQLIADGDTALNDFFAQYYDIDHQMLRQLVRNSQSKNNAQALRAKRKLFKFIAEIIPNHTGNIS